MARNAAAEVRSVDTDSARLRREETFHDGWARDASTDLDVVRFNEACTSPEMRKIMAVLGDLRGKRLLDVGCGLGEASVYFAVKGATVTSVDLSEEMLVKTKELAERHGVEVDTLKAPAEELHALTGAAFDVIYVGNLFHHVDIAATVPHLKSVLAPGGVMVSWDPVAYNPLINLYRRIATDVRTPDEHPFKKSDVDLFRSHFSKVDTHFYWLTTLVVFIAMVAIQFRSPNKVRFWKKVVEEADFWAPIYKPLEALDRVLLSIAPPLGWLCWNVVLVCRNPR